MGPTERIAGLLTEFRLESAPPRAIAAAKERVLDTVAVGLAGLSLEAGRIAAAHARGRRQSGEAGVWGSGFRASAEDAALANGVLAHAHMWDDNGTAMVGHPSAPLVPAILSVAEWRGSSGRDVIRAFIMGFEIEVRLGRALNPVIYDLGWHNTSVIGTLGAAVAVGSLLGLTAEQMRIAIGIAVSLASGVRQNFSTMTAALHVGQAARSGVTAALLAEQGFTADATCLEAPMGFAEMFTAHGKCDLSSLTAGWADPLEIINPGSALKLHPAGGPTNSGIDAVLDIAQSAEVRPDRVAEIVWAGPRWVTEKLLKTDLRQGIEGKLSLPFCLAAALVDREVALRQFTDEKVRDPLIRELMARVRATVHPEFPDDALNFPAEVTVRLLDGTVHRRTVLRAKGHPDNPLSREELLGKYRQCADGVLTTAACERSIALLETLDQLDDVRELCRTVCCLDGEPA